MSTDLLLQIVLALVAIATILLILVLWRAYLVLTDTNEVTTIAKKRAKDIDSWIGEIHYSVKSFTDLMKGFSSSVEKIKEFKNKIMGDETKKKGE